MQHPNNTSSWIRTSCFCAVMGMLALLAGCQEVNTAIDSLLGKRSPVLSAAQKSLPLAVVPVKKRPAGEMPPPTPSAGQTEERKSSAEGKLVSPKGLDDKSRGHEDTKQAKDEAATPVAEQTKPVPPFLATGKKRAPGPGNMAPRPRGEQVAKPTIVAEKPVTDFTVVRDPFKAPTEILPSECPPSMPLCRFDRSQLKVVGVIQVENGQFKGMVEDPDGRGYFITPGMQIGGATVTQVTNKGIMLHIAKSKQDVMMPLFLEAREAQEF